MLSKSKQMDLENIYLLKIFLLPVLMNLFSEEISSLLLFSFKLKVEFSWIDDNVNLFIFP